MRDAPDVLLAVLIRETEITVQPVPDVVTVEHIGGPAALDQRALQRHADGRLAGTRQAGDPHRAAWAAGHGRTIAVRNIRLVPGEIVRFDHQCRPVRV